MPFMAALPAILQGASLLGKVFGGAAKGSADQRTTENQQRLQQQQQQNWDVIQRALLQSNNANTRASMQNEAAQARAAIQNANAMARASMTNSDTYQRAGMDLARRQFAQQEPSVQARQAMAGSLLSRIQPVQIAGAPAGVGVKSSIMDALGPEARQSGALLAQRGLSGLQRGPAQFSELPPVSLPDAYLPDAVSLPEIMNLPPATQAALQKSGMLEKIMGGLGLAGNIAGAVGSLGTKKSNFPTHDGDADPRYPW
jgi:hypothetical protein